MIYFTADTHLGDDFINKFSRRGYVSPAEHDRSIVEKINDTVEDFDTLYVVGDFANKDYSKYLHKIRCYTILLIGNHDHYGIHQGFRDIAEVTYEDKLFVLSHYPMIFPHASHRESIHLYGHTHGLREDYLDALLGENRLSIDVGVDNAKHILGDHVPFSADYLLSHFDGKIGHDLLSITS